MTYTHVLWDWNGTLIDDVGCAVECVNDTLKGYNLPLTSLSEYLETIEPSLENYYGKFIDLSKHTMTEILESFQQGYAKRVDYLHIMDGADDIIKTLYSHGAHQYIVSSFVEDKLREHVEKFGLTAYFDAVSGAGDILCGPKAERALNLIKDTDKSECIFIGDSINDYKTACEICCDCILIAKGHQSLSDLQKCRENSPITVYIRKDIKEVTSIIFN